jgi:uncharacterized membrane protein HdeD (DUF308 family)
MKIEFKKRSIMTTDISTTPKREIHASFWSGILLIGLGVLGIAIPTVSSIVIETWIALILVSSGAAKLVYAYQTREDKGFIWKILLGALYIATGATLFFAPLTGVLTLTLLIGSFLLTEGSFNIILALRVRPQQNWLWVLGDGIITLLLGLMVWLQFPSDAPWLLGTLVGASVLFTGISRAMLAWNPRSAAATIQPEQSDQATSA